MKAKLKKFNKYCGDLSGVRGNLSEVSGDLSDCKITKEDRDRGVDINQLIDPAKDLQKNT